MRYDPFPSARAMGSGHSIYDNNDNNGIIISHWQGEFKTEGKEEKSVTILLYEVGNFGMDEWFGLYIERKFRRIKELAKVVV